MQISEAAGGVPAPGAEPCRFPKLEECAHFHYERVQLPTLTVTLQTNMDQSLHSQHSTNEDDDTEWFMVQVTSGDQCWLLQRNFENFRMLDDQLHQCIFDRKISRLPDLAELSPNDEELDIMLKCYLERFSNIANNSVNCGPVLNWLQMDNKGHRLLVPSEESRSINTPAVAAAYSVRRYVSQARDELNLEVGDMISVIDMASPGESMWWRGKRGFQVGFFPQHCVHIIGDKIPRNMPLPPPVVGSLALTPIKPVLRKHGKLITFFRSFILNRPSRRRLKQSGILKERVFGCDLGEHLLNSGHDVPNVLKCCAEFIERKGIVDGIYRLSGITSNIQKLRNAFDEDRIPNLYTDEILQDIHSVASLLKMYFRELPNPLCTYQLYQSFVNAVQGCSTALRTTETDHERLLKMREAVQKLPPPHYRTLEYLMRHLARVAKHGASTGMTTRNVAIVWAPNLLRCEALEVGGVAALQGVGVQAVVTEFLICYADLIFCDHLPNLDIPEKENMLVKKCRPNSLPISTPTKLITLEEARNKHLMSKTDECGYIEVGGGPKNLPKKYHTIIELPSGARKRNHTKRSPLGWRMFFSKSRNNSQNNLNKNREASAPITINEKSVTESDLTDMKRKLRSVKSAESLTSGHSEPASTEDVLGPLHTLNKPPGHNRSVSHDSYFDTLQNSRNNSEGSLLDLSEIHLNFDLEESEMHIFSEDESLISSPRIQKDSQRRILTRSRDDYNDCVTNSINPSPKKQARVVLSPDSMSRKRTRLEDQLSDIQYIDCNTPENVVGTTTALIHTLPDSPVAPPPHQENNVIVNSVFESYQPKNKSPRNSEDLDKRQSLNLECHRVSNKQRNSISSTIPKSFTEHDFNRKYLGGVSVLTTPTPGSPGYKQLGESSSNTTPGFSPNYDSGSPAEITYQQLENNFPNNTANAHNYENILTTISITYKSPPRSVATSPVKSPVYENVFLNAEKVEIPTSTASLPIQEASQPVENFEKRDFLSLQEKNNGSERPKSLSALEDYSSTDSTLKANSSSAICNTSEQLLSLSSLAEQKTLSSNQSSRSNVQYTASLSSAPYHFIENAERLSPTDLSLSEVVQSSTENLSTSQTSLSFPVSTSKNSLSPIVSPSSDVKNSTEFLSSENLVEANAVWVKDSTEFLPSENVIEANNVWGVPRSNSINLIDFSPLNEEILSPMRSISQNDKRKSDETEALDDNAIYQQVKYFRRSIHEVNALLDIENNEKSTNDGEKSVNDDGGIYEDVDVRNQAGEENYDSLEAGDDHVYENLEGESLRNDETGDETDGKSDASKGSVVTHEKVTVKDLKSRFEEKRGVESEVKSTPTPVVIKEKIKSCEVSEENSETEKVQLDESKATIRSDVPRLNDASAVSDSQKVHLNESTRFNDVSAATVNDVPRSSSSSGNTTRLKKFYEKDSLPPCLRARNLKNQFKTRSLDEEEFEKECQLKEDDQRRKSLDESMSYKTNSLPKRLNQPKCLPIDSSSQLVNTLHLSHSQENLARSRENLLRSRENLNVSAGSVNGEEEEQKKRERIERYKEERRRILHEKYRSESFKEDKDVILSRLKIYKPKDSEANVDINDLEAADKPTRVRRKSTKSECETIDVHVSAPPSLSKTSQNVSNPEVNRFNKSAEKINKKESKINANKQPMTDTLKSRAAIFEQKTNVTTSNADKLMTSLPPIDFRNANRRSELSKDKVLTKEKEVRLEKKDVRLEKENKVDVQSDELQDLDFIRSRKRVDDVTREERRRHTYESRERETDAERTKRVSLESRNSPRKEKTSPTYCIKDMKAIFESKSKQ